MGFPCPGLTPEALAVLQAQDFSGNARELRNFIERALIESGGRTIGAEHLHFLPPATAGNTADPAVVPEDDPTRLDLPLNLREAERILIDRALTASGHNVSAAARLLGINRSKLYRRISALQI
jgi:DNA-binding NtrC family response regulator